MDNLKGCCWKLEKQGPNGCMKAYRHTTIMGANHITVVIAMILTLLECALEEASFWYCELSMYSFRVGVRPLPIINHWTPSKSLNWFTRRFSIQRELCTSSHHQASKYLLAQSDNPLKTSAWSPSHPGELTINSLANRILRIDIVPLQQHLNRPGVIQPSLRPKTGTQPRSQLSNPHSHHPQLVASRIAIRLRTRMQWIHSPTLSDASIENSGGFN